MANRAVEPLVILTACYFHDIVSLPKTILNAASHPSWQRVKRVRSCIATSRTFPAHYDAVAHAIEAHSFSAGIAPQSLEAKIVQDADRLEALGAIGRRACLPFLGRWACRF